MFQGVVALHNILIAMAKITVGFKCEPELKYDLSLEATSTGVTLSEYVENICANRMQMTHSEDNESAELKTLRMAFERMQNRVDKYELEMLAPVYQKYQGQMVDMKLPDGSSVKKQVNTPMDILEVILASLKQ